MKTIKKAIFMILVIVIISTILLPFSALANQSGQIAYGAANVAASGLRVRSNPNLDASILTNLDQGSVIVILERTNSDWYKIGYNGTVGFVSTAFIEDVREAANFNAVGTVVGSNVNVRERPDINTAVVTSYDINTSLNIIGINTG
jgi:uncharacterized protein YgiM (DUF1202 family)